MRHRPRIHRLRSLLPEQRAGFRTALPSKSQQGPRARRTAMADGRAGGGADEGGEEARKRAGGANQGSFGEYLDRDYPNIGHSPATPPPPGHAASAGPTASADRAASAPSSLGAGPAVGGAIGPILPVGEARSRRCVMREHVSTVGSGAGPVEEESSPRGGGSDPGEEGDFAGARRERSLVARPPPPGGGGRATRGTEAGAAREGGEKSERRGRERGRKEESGDGAGNFRRHIASTLERKQQTIKLQRQALEGAAAASPGGVAGLVSNPRPGRTCGRRRPSWRQPVPGSPQAAAPWPEAGRRKARRRHKNNLRRNLRLIRDLATLRGPTIEGKRVGTKELTERTVVKVDGLKRRRFGA
uniref:Uncharacterized protein n=1 Tax=Setaria viridis TaxID=4556 RepID=A0A4U6T9M4_SETVI|nr:LOW QUALITY PROTEIN: hypothetical protein SEVIR_9G573500v2 [Setaria viridis]